MRNLNKLTRNELKHVSGGLKAALDSTSCSAGCGETITNCNGTCSATENSVTCQGPTKSLTKTC